MDSALAFDSLSLAAIDGGKEADFNNSSALIFFLRDLKHIIIRNMKIFFKNRDFFKEYVTSDFRVFLGKCIGADSCSAVNKFLMFVEP